jgi:hypothetical protein
VAVAVFWAGRHDSLDGVAGDDYLFASPTTRRPRLRVRDDTMDGYVGEGTRPTASTPTTSSSAGAGADLFYHRRNVSTIGAVPADLTRNAGVT